MFHVAGALNPVAAPLAPFVLERITGPSVPALDTADPAMALPSARPAGNA